MPGPGTDLSAPSRVARARADVSRVQCDPRAVVDGVVTAEPGASDQLWETHFPGGIAEGWGLLSGSVCVLPSGRKEVEALLGRDPTCYKASLISDS